VRNNFAQTFYRLAQADPKLCLVVADISPAGSIEQFRQDFPDRFINTGVAEQVMIGMCAGMAQKGLRPFAYTIATFALYRPFEMIRDDLAYQNLPVTVVGIGGGVSYAALGGTHHAQEDIFIASSIPNMQVIVPCDPLEVEAATEYCASQTNGPVYMRLGRAGEPALTKDALENFVFGKARYLKKGEKTCILSYGAIMGLAVELYEDYRQQGHNPSLVCVHTLKPLDNRRLSAILEKYDEIIIIEEVSPEGYLAAKVKQLAWEKKSSAKIHAFSLKDEFIHVYGKPHELLEAHGLSLNQIKSHILLESQNAPSIEDQLATAVEPLDQLCGDYQTYFPELITKLYSELQNSKPINQAIAPELSMFPFSFKESILFSVLAREVNQRLSNGYYNDRLVVLPTLEKSASTLHEIILMRMLEIERGVAGYTPLVRSLYGPISLAGGVTAHAGMLFYLLNGGVMRGIFDSSFSNFFFFNRRIKPKKIVLFRHPADRLVAVFCMNLRHLLEWENDKDISEGCILSNMLKGKYEVSAPGASIYCMGIKTTLEWMDGWVKKYHPGNMLFCKYENMMDSFENHFQEIYKFLFNKEPTKDLLDEFKNISHKTKEGGEYQPGDMKSRSYNKGYSGKVGIWRNYFSEEDIVFYNNTVEKYLSYCDEPDKMLELYPDLLLK